jgi:hypothetical protein
MPELAEKTINSPNRTKTTTIGIIHQSFLFQRKLRSSLKTPNFAKVLFPIVKVVSPVPAIT